VYGSVLASYCVEEFSIDGLRDLAPDRIAARYKRLQEITKFGN
jgi:hypothetical protein